jgi:hypothetical protein
VSLPDRRTRADTARVTASSGTGCVLA